jgi:hypothetical protein
VGNNSSDNIARFSCAFVSITKVFRGKNATLHFIASVISASVVIVTYFCNMDATLDRIAAIDGAYVIVVTIVLCVLASVDTIARIDGARVIVITILLFREVAHTVNTFIDSAEIIIHTFRSDMNTFISLYVTFVNCARILIVTAVDVKIFIFNKPSSRIAFVMYLGFASSGWDLEASQTKMFETNSISFASCGFSSTIFGNEFWNSLTTLLRMAVIDSAFIAVFAIDWGIDDSFLSITSSQCACIWSFDRYNGIDAVSSESITTSDGTSVVVVASV